MRVIANDGHLWVRYEPELIAMIKKAEADGEDKELEEYMLREMKNINYGFKEVKILPGNVGYLNLTRFTNAYYAGEAAVATMQFLSNVNAIIFDLRQNGGGSPSMIQLITSYLYDEDETKHLNSFYFRPTDEYQQFWTLPYVPGKHMPDVDVYVLTSNRTFSGAEEFTYNLKNMERATIIGETTGGGAHPIDRHILNDNFAMGLPSGRAINPITETNWEGVGVEPHIQVPRAEAMDKAYLMALKKLKEKEKDEKQLAFYQWTIDGLEARTNPLDLSPKELKKYSGVYGPRKITLEDGKLIYQREDGPRMQMIPMGDNLFWFREIDYFRLEVVMEDGKSNAVIGHYESGSTDKHQKTK
jgi:C-terminal processing protease CtpA/Prc